MYKETHLLKLTQLRWTGHVARMPGDYNGKFSMENFSRESALKVAKINAINKRYKDIHP